MGFSKSGNMFTSIMKTDFCRPQKVIFSRTVTLHEIYRDIDFLLSIFSRRWTESYPYFLVFGQNWRFCPNMGKYGYDSVHMRENTDQRKSVFWYMSSSGQNHANLCKPYIS